MSAPQDIVSFVTHHLRQGDSHVSLENFTGSAKAYALAQLIQESDVPPLLVIEASDELAERLYGDLRFFAGEVKEREAARLPTLTPAAIRWYEGENALPYEPGGVHLDSTVARVATLFQLTQSDIRTRIVITSIGALLRRTLPHKYLGRLSELVEQGEQIDRARLIASLSAGGYVHAPTCEDVGTYSVRGGVIDVFCPLYASPIRIELFGDTVELLRSYDPATQRTLHQLKEVRICPAREVILDAETVERARDALETLTDSLNFPSRKLRILQEELEARINFFGIEAYLPAFYESMETLADYARTQKMVWLWDQRGRIEEAESALHQKADDEYARTLRDHKLHYPPEQHYKRIEQVLHYAAMTLDASMHVQTAAHFTLPFEEPVELRARLQVSRELPVSFEHFKPLADYARKLFAARMRLVCVVSSLAQAERLKDLLSEHKIPLQIAKTPFSFGVLSALNDQRPHLVIMLGELSEGFIDAQEKITFLSESDLFGPRLHRKSVKKRDLKGEAVSDLKTLKEGDALVHADFGIGRYLGLVRLKIRGVEEDYLYLEYAGGDKLYLPIYRMNLIQRYGADGHSARLDKLGGTAWQSKKQRVKDAILAMAHDLIELYAQRELAEVEAMQPPSHDFKAFEALFPYDETPDQEKAIADVIGDLQKSRPMDRLICGDVGYGKTEVAIRAAYFAVLSGKQVVMLAPTTVLAEQHYQNFKNRFEQLPVTIEGLSRFRDPKMQKEIVKRLKEGTVDIVIGTHRLLSQDVDVKRLGLVIIDEEQRFGVRHKERLRKIKNHTHVLAMSATPIPRTLQMSFLQIRDLSIISTPPVDRLAVRTQVTPFDEEIIREAMQREIKRGGQLFFVHNRVQSIFSMADFLKRIVPEAKIVVGHGQMSGEQLEQVMMDFVQKRANVLVSTTIIESGIDIPSANTMIVNRADAFGLSQLYQLRGRIGRGNERAYAVLLVPKNEKITEDARRRLEALKRFSDLGAGFKIASHDLEIRGSGNLLGPDQSGHIEAVGFELYSDLVKQAVEEIKGRGAAVKRDAEIRLPVVALIPEKYVEDTALRLNYYKRMAHAESDESLFNVAEELSDFYGPLPDAVEMLTRLMLIKRRLLMLGALTLDGGLMPGKGAKIAMTFDPQAAIDRDKLIAWVISLGATRAQLLPEGKLVYIFTAQEVAAGPDLMEHIKTLLNHMLQTFVPSPSASPAGLAGKPQ